MSEASYRAWGSSDTIGNELYRDSIHVLECLHKSSKDFFALKNRREKTQLIKRTLATLGHHLDYKVYANGLIDDDMAAAPFKNREWLFDLQWYTEPKDVYEKNKGYRTLSFPMVMECEWDGRRRGEKERNEYSAMKYDFQKVIATNAKLQIMIFKLIKKTDCDSIDSYVDDLLLNYEDRTKTAIVLLIGFHQRSKTIFYREIKASSREGQVT